MYYFRMDVIVVEIGQFELMNGLRGVVCRFSLRDFFGAVSVIVYDCANFKSIRFPHTV